MIKRMLKILIGILCLLGLCCGILALTVSRGMMEQTKGQFVSLQELEGEYDCILVLGAGVYSDGSPTPILSDRLSAGIAAYETGVSHCLLMSGDYEKAGYDEITPMLEAARAAGVPEEALAYDRFGLCTYDSLYRAKEVFGARRVVIITQRYHMYRALYLAQALGLEAVGLEAEGPRYIGQLYRDVRELLACVKAKYWVMKLPEPAYPSEK